MMRRLVVVLALLALAGCWSVPEVERREIRRWLLCTDCSSDELARVVAMGPRAERYLRASITDGPTAAEDSVLRRNATESVLRARRYRTDHLIAATISTDDSSAAVRQQVDDYRLRYRLRAAEALSQIDSALAGTAVERFCGDSTPELTRRPAYKAQFAQYGACP